MLSGCDPFVGLGGVGMVGPRSWQSTHRPNLADVSMAEGSELQQCLGCGACKQLIFCGISLRGTIQEWGSVPQKLVDAFSWLFAGDSGRENWRDFIGRGKWRCKKYRRIPSVREIAGTPEKLFKTRHLQLSFFEGSLPSCCSHSAGYTCTFLHLHCTSRGQNKGPGISGEFWRNSHMKIPKLNINFLTPISFCSSAAVIEGACAARSNLGLFHFRVLCDQPIGAEDALSPKPEPLISVLVFSALVI